LRRTCMSILIDQGEGIIYIRRRFGGTKASTTLVTYNYLSKRETLDAAKEPGGAIVGQLDINGSKMVANKSPETATLA
jgi:hypothetical protein